jgi:hypothetical protein
VRDDGFGLSIFVIGDILGIGGDIRGGCHDRTQAERDD